MTIPAITAFSSSLWTAIEAPLANHLWQSTLFAAVAGLLALTVRKNSARVRYWLWLAASVKFVIPFSLLVSVGSCLGWSKISAQPGFTFVIEEMSQPFSAASSHAEASTALATLTAMLPTLLLNCLGVRMHGSSDPLVGPLAAHHSVDTWSFSSKLWTRVGCPAPS